MCGRAWVADSCAGTLSMHTGMVNRTAPGFVALQGIRTSHQEFMYGDGTTGARAREVFTSLQSGSTGQDCNGHGTHVAAVVAGLTFGVAKNATLLSVRALECMGNGTVSQVWGCAPIPLAVCSGSTGYTTTQSAHTSGRPGLESRLQRMLHIITLAARVRPGRFTGD